MQIQGRLSIFKRSRARRGLVIAACIGRIVASWSLALADEASGESALKKPLRGKGSSITTAILVDKKTNTLQVAGYRDGAYFPIKSYHATLGKVKGDKEEEGDLKTPEGIYTFKSLLKPPAIKPKFGAMALYLNYP
ncbi:MAG: peptidoglycan peptidase 2, partial [Pseudomonadota bacterium]